MNPHRLTARLSVGESQGQIAIVDDDLDALRDMADTLEATGWSEITLASFHRLSGKWSAQIRHLKHKIHLGLFWSEEEAAVVYDQKAAELFGPTACLNFDARHVPAA